MWPLFLAAFHTAAVTDLSFSPDGRLLATASLDGTVKIWRVSDWKLSHDVRLSPYGLTCLDFSPDGRLLAVGGFDRAIILLDPAKGKVLGEIKNAHRGFICDLEFSSDGKILASCGDDGKVKLWEATSWKLVKDWDAHRYCVLDLSFSPDGRLLASGGWDREVKIWDLTKGGRLVKEWKAHNCWVRCVEFSPDGSYLATGGFEDGLVRFWDVKANFSLLATVEAEPAGRITSLSHDAKGRRMASAGGAARLWDMEEGVLVAFFKFTGHYCHVISVAPSPDGRYLAAGAWDGSVGVWEVETGKKLMEVRPR